MVIKITDRVLGETYLAHKVEDCRDLPDALLYRKAEADGRNISTAYGSAEIVERQ